MWDNTFMGLKRQSVEDRLMEGCRQDPDTGCWLWQRSKNREGYGRTNRGGHNGQGIVAHKLSYETFVGPIPQGMQLDHLCRNRSCINPDHLEPVTPKENIRRGTGHGKETNCPAGHEYNESNTYFEKIGGNRHCKVCDRDRKRVRRELNKEAYNEYMRQYQRRHRGTATYA